MGISLYTISLFTHILFVIAWMFTIPVHMIIDRAVEKLDQVSKQFEMMKIASLNGTISIISAIVVFFTGALMIEEGNLGWAPSDGGIWLVTKQTIWLILLIASVAFLRPLNSNLHDLIDTGGEETEIFDTYKKLKIRGHILTTLILINIFLAVTKPF